MQREIECAIFQDSREMSEAIEVLSRQGFDPASLSIILFPAAPAGAATGVSAGRRRVRWPLSVRALALPGVGPLIAAGPIARSLRGVGVNYFAARVAQLLIRIGIVERDARHYECGIKGGGILLAVHCGSSGAAKRARDLLSRPGARACAQRSPQPGVVS